MKPIERFGLSFLDEPKIYLSPFSPLFLWKSIAARLWEGRLPRKVTTAAAFARKRASHPRALVVLRFLLNAPQVTFRFRMKQVRYSG